MGALSTFLAGRLGAPVFFAALLVSALVVGGLLIDRASLKDDLRDEQRRGDVLEYAVKEQNAAVVSMQERAATDTAERSARAVRALAPPRQKPNPQTVKELNQWLAQP